MGASSWTYYVPYQEDIEQALQTLRQQVFSSGDYQQWWFPDPENDLHGYVDFWGEEIQLLPPPPPQTIEEALQCSQGQGTHSILDIFHISPYSRFYEVIPIPEEILMQFFQDNKPTPEVVEAIVTCEAIWSGLHACIGIYVYCRTSDPKQHTIFKFPEEIINLVSEPRPQQELVKAFLSQEEMWLAIYHCLRFG